jgi:hypothetical protein
MQKMTRKQDWAEYCDYVLRELAPVFKKHRLVLDAVQPHISGERFLMQAVTVTHGKKLILCGTYKGEKAIIKVSNDKGGIEEMEHERLCRNKINDIDFAGERFLTPRELAHFKSNDFLISIQEFIAQESTFLERPIQEQFAYALKAFKAQESAHVTTYKHSQSIRGVFQVRSADEYLTTFTNFIKKMESHTALSDTVQKNLRAAEALLQKNKNTIEQYCGFLTHTDFVPHNVRIRNRGMYLLDYSALIFGNKYEGWARFLNFMTLYNQPLEQALITYIQKNRTPEESLSLQMMRIYRLGEILWYYAKTLERSSGDLLLLNAARVHFWGDVLSYVLKNEMVPESLVVEYQKTRDGLRSEEEKERQKELH